MTEYQPPKPDKGPWNVQAWPNDKIVIQSEDFTHDVALIVTGDFESSAQKMQYAENLAAGLNLNSRCDAMIEACTAQRIRWETAIAGATEYSSDPGIIIDIALFGLDKLDYYDMSEAAQQTLYDAHEQDMPYEVLKARTATPNEWLSERIEGFLGIK